MTQPMYMLAARGEQLPHSKLTAAQVRSMRAEHVPYSRTHGAPALARKYGVHLRTVEKILTWGSWTHVREAA